MIISSCYDGDYDVFAVISAGFVVDDDFAVFCSASDDDFAVILSTCDDNDNDHYALSKNAEFLEHHFSHACDDNDDDHYALSNNAEFFVFFVALRPTSTAMVIAGWSVHLTTLFPGQA